MWSIMIDPLMSNWAYVLICGIPRDFWEILFLVTQEFHRQPLN